jgi:hypothetical protein
MLPWRAKNTLGAVSFDSDMIMVRKMGVARKSSEGKDRQLEVDHVWKERRARG